MIIAAHLVSPGEFTDESIKFKVNNALIRSVLVAKVSITFRYVTGGDFHNCINKYQQKPGGQQS